MSSLPRGDTGAVGEEVQRALFTAEDAHEGYRQARRLLGGASFAVSVVATALLAFGLYEVAVNPPDWHGGGDNYSYGFQFAGAVAFLVPVALLAACAALVGAALVQGPLGRLWRFGEQGVLAGWAPALVTVAGVAVGDQLLGAPATTPTLAGAGFGMIAFAVMWLGVGRLMGARVWPRVTQALAVTAVVAAFVGASTMTRVQDEHNLVIYLKPGAALAAPAPLSAGFHTVRVQEVAAVRGMRLTCANSSDCVATGVGTYPGGPSPFMSFAMVGASSDGGNSWSVKALPLSVLVPLPPSCAGRRCNVPLEMAAPPGAGPEVTLMFGRRGAPARFGYSASAVRPPGSTDTIQCHGEDCVVFGEKTAPSATAGGSRHSGSPDRRVASPHEVAVAWYSANGGKRWAMTVLPEPHNLTTSGSGGSAGPAIFGPWCSSGSHCTGALGVGTGDCNSALLPPKCLSQTEMVFTEDGGRTWTGQVLPTSLGNVQDLTCEAGIYCTAVGPDARLVISDDGGRTWSVRGPAPEDVYCWSATRCLAGDGANDDLLTTEDGGRHWEHQALGTTGFQSFDPVHCSSIGQCIATGVERAGQEYVLTRPAQDSGWAAHPFPVPQMLSLPLPLHQ